MIAFLFTLILIFLCAVLVIFYLLPLAVRLWIKSLQKRHRVDHTPQQKKRINRSEGEYVDFEEIK